MLSKLSEKITQLDYEINRADLDVSTIRDQLAELADIVGGLIGYFHMAELKKAQVAKPDECPECKQNAESGMNFCACCGRQVWNVQEAETDLNAIPGLQEKINERFKHYKKTGKIK